MLWMRDNIFMSSQDLKKALLVGFLTGWLSLPVLLNVGVISWTFLNVVGTIVVFSIGAPLGLGTFYLIARLLPVARQVGRYGVIGVFNSFIDLGVLNILILLSGISSGVYFSLFKAISFSVAVTNSYFWNKFWTFRSQSEVRASEFAKFVCFSLGGLAINNLIASLVVNVIGAPAGFDPKIWANIGACSSVLLVLAWNFLGYRYLVFKGHKTGKTQA